MNEIAKIKFADIGHTVTGKTPSSNNPEDFGSEYMFVTPSDSFDSKMMNTTERFLSEEGVAKLSNKLLPPKSIMITCIGSAMGKASMNKTSCITNQQINSIIPYKNYYQDYVYYSIKNNYKLLRNASTGSTALPLLNKTDFDLLELPIHTNKETQQKIASVLSALDSKIELNNRINAELEAMAKTLYDYWFVQFDFPNAKGKPYKTSGGKMVWNEELKREIPEGWEVKDLGEIINIFDSKRIPLSRVEREKKVGNIPYYGATSVMGYVDEYIFNDDYILVAEDGSVMDENGFPIVQFIWGKTWVNNHAHVIQAKDVINNEYIFYLVKTISVIQIMSGSIQLKINQENLKSVKVCVPNQDTLKKFASFAMPVRKQLINSIEENQKLTELRDWLLPMLMNGQVKVN
jgi:type I restriction enzyme S subunit